MWGSEQTTHRSASSEARQQTAVKSRTRDTITHLCAPTRKAALTLQGNEEVPPPNTPPRWGDPTEKRADFLQGSESGRPPAAPSSRGQHRGVLLVRGSLILGRAEGFHPQELWKPEHGGRYSCSVPFPHVQGTQGVTLLREHRRKITDFPSKLTDKFGVTGPRTPTCVPGRFQTLHLTVFFLPGPCVQAPHFSDPSFSEILSKQTTAQNLKTTKPK